MAAVLELGGSQARVMNLVLVITASRLVGGPGTARPATEDRDTRPGPGPSMDTGLGLLMATLMVESAEQNNKT